MVDLLLLSISRTVKKTRMSENRNIVYICKLAVKWSFQHVQFDFGLGAFLEKNFEFRNYCCCGVGRHPILEVVFHHFASSCELRFDYGVQFAQVPEHEQAKMQKYSLFYHHLQIFTERWFIIFALGSYESVFEIIHLLHIFFLSRLMQVIVSDFNACPVAFQRDVIIVSSASCQIQ